MTWLDNSIGSKIFRLESTFIPFEIRSYLNPNAPLKVTKNERFFRKGEQSSLRSQVAKLQNNETFWVILHHCEADYFLVLLGLGVLMVLWRLMDVYAAKVESHPTDKLYFGLTAEMVLRRSHSPYTCQQIWRQSHGITANQKLFPISPLHGYYYVLNTNC